MRDPPAERKLRAAPAGTFRVLSSEPRSAFPHVRLLAGLLGLWLATSGFATLVVVAGVVLTSMAPGRGAVAAPEVAVFPQPAASRARVAALRNEIAALPGVTAARVIAGEVAVDEALRRAGAAAPSLAGRQPLVPDVIVVRFDPTRPADALDTVVASLRRLAEVDAVVGDLGWFRQWEAVRSQGQRAARSLGALAGLLALGALVAASVLFARAAADDERRHPASLVARRTALVGAVLFALAMSAAVVIARALNDVLLAAWATLGPLVAVEPAWVLDSPAKVIGTSAVAAVVGALGTLLAGWLTGVGSTSRGPEMM